MRTIIPGCRTKVEKQRNHPRRAGQIFWPDLSIIVPRNWQLVYDSPDDLACMIFAYADPGTNDTSKAGEVLPADLPF